MHSKILQLVYRSIVTKLFVYRKIAFMIHKLFIFTNLPIHLSLPFNEGRAMALTKELPNNNIKKCEEQSSIQKRKPPPTSWVRVIRPMQTSKVSNKTITQTTFSLQLS